MKNLKARSSIFDEEESYIFSGSDEDFRFSFEKLGSIEILLDEIKTTTGKVLQLLKNNPQEEYTPKRVNSILKLGNAKLAWNILATLYGKNLIGRQEVDINTGGRTPYYYFSR